MAGDTAWSPAPRELNGRVVFAEHYSMHPGHYTFAEKLGIATKVDVKKMFGKSPTERKKAFAEFSTIRAKSPVGVLAPDFELETTTGETVRLSDKRGRIAVFMFVAMTCPPARTQVDLWKGLYEKYDVSDVEIFFGVDGQVGDFTEDYKEIENISTIFGNISAQRYKVTGSQDKPNGKKIDYDIWYDNKKRWVKTKFFIKNSLIEYFLVTKY